MHKASVCLRLLITLDFCFLFQKGGSVFPRTVVCLVCVCCCCATLFGLSLFFTFSTAMRGGGGEGTPITRSYKVKGASRLSSCLLSVICFGLWLGWLGGAAASLGLRQAGRHAGVGVGM